MKDYKIITLGGAGCQLCKVLLSQGVDASRISLFSTDPMAVAYLDLKDKFFVGEGTLRTCSSESTKELFNRHVALFENAIEPDVLYILVCGLGGKTGTGFAVNLAKLLIEKNREFVIIATLPGKWEGQRKASIALHALAELQLLAGENVISLPLDDIVTPGMNLVEYFEKADQWVVATIKDDRNRKGLKNPFPIID